MRFPKYMLLFLALVSVAANFVLYRRTLAHRAHVQINGTTYTKGSLYDWLERRYNQEMTARMVAYELILQAARKAGVAPDPKEVQDEIKSMQDLQPQYAAEFRMKPWLKEDATQDIEMKLALRNLRAKDVKVSDTEVHTYFVEHPGQWDTPDRFFTKAVVAKTEEQADQARQLMEKVGDVVVIRQQIGESLDIVGTDGTWVFSQPVGKPATNSQIAEIERMKDGQTKVLRVSKIQYLVIRKEKSIPGHVATLPEVKSKVERDLEVSRAAPQKEMLRKLWDAANVQMESSDLKVQVEYLLFPERYAKLHSN